MKARVYIWAATIMMANGLVATAHAMCFEDAAQQYNVNAQLLRGIAQVESSMRPQAMNHSHKERTGSYDIGLMQINSTWLPLLAKQNITEKLLVEDACLNVKVGAWILSKTMTRHGASWNGVGAYNAACTQLQGAECERARMGYSHKVWQAMNRLAVQPKTKNHDRQGDALMIAQSQSEKTSRLASVDVSTLLKPAFTEKKEDDELTNQ